MTQKGSRIEKDTMGEMEVPTEAYWGASTQRAVLNFPVSNLRYPPDFIHILGQIKRAAARANARLGLLDSKTADAIVSAATEVVDGKWDDHFVIDLFQTGSGTSSNTNANEVISKRAREIAEGVNVHPNDHVNMAQSSNDVIPTASHLTVARVIQDDLLPALAQAQATLEAKSKEFWGIIKTGRTHLQDATPIRLGQEFAGYASQLQLAQARLRPHVEALAEVALGGTAVGTGINAHEDFSALACEILSEELGLPVRETPHHFQAQNTQDTMLAASGALRSAAVSLQKIGNDLRWLASGPRAGLGELELPTVQPGSSIMPGKVNPVIPESVCQVAAHVIGNDAAIAVAGQSGNFEINVMMPVAAHNLLESIEILASSARNLATQCISGITATERGPEMVHNGLAIVTTLVPVIGYDAAAAIAKKAQATGESIRVVAARETDLSDEDLDRILDPATMTDPNLAPKVSLG